MLIIYKVEICADSAEWALHCACRPSLLAAATDRAVLLFDVVQVIVNHRHQIILFKSSVKCTSHFFCSKINCSSFTQNRTGPVVAVRTSERKVCTDTNIQKYKYVKYKAITAYTVSLSQVKLPLGAVAFPATDGSRLAAGDKYYPSFFLITRWWSTIIMIGNCDKIRYLCEIRFGRLYIWRLPGRLNSATIQVFQLIAMTNTKFPSIWKKKKYRRHFIIFLLQEKNVFQNIPYSTETWMWWKVVCHVDKILQRKLYKNRN